MGQGQWHRIYTNITENTKYIHYLFRNVSIVCLFRCLFSCKSKKFERNFKSDSLFQFGRAPLIVPSLFSNLVNACQSNKSLYQCYEIDTQTHANRWNGGIFKYSYNKMLTRIKKKFFQFFFHLIRCFRRYNNRLNYLCDCITHNGNALSRFLFYYLLFKWDCVLWNRNPVSSPRMMMPLMWVWRTFDNFMRFLHGMSNNKIRLNLKDSVFPRLCVRVTDSGARISYSDG